ncbi:MAG: pentapeptide repeat-containing protein [Bacteriovoracaceae bacterium]|nr:pentapeptide repeat-containing protein [Bacteriovoracaceae bacterium]
MNTLTKFIDAQLSLSHHLTAGERLGIDEASAAGLYEIIENEEIKSRHFNSLAVSGSLFSLTTFTDVTFESCVFYASKLENCTFINCNFIDCKFEFTQMQHCRFNGCKMEDTTFSVSPIKKCTIAFTQFDHKFSYFLSKEENRIINCQELEPVTWEEALENEELKAQATVTTENNDEEATASLKINLISAVQEALSKFKVA